MAITVDLQNTGDPAARAEVIAAIEHALSERSGDWHVSIIGSRENDNWEMKIEGPKGFERSYTLVGASGEHQPDSIRRLLRQLLTRSS